MKLQPGTAWKTAGKPLGGHAMVVVGYDDDQNAFRLMNSWGQEWCEGGFGWVTTISSGRSSAKPTS